MAMFSNHEENQLKIKVSGDLGDLEIAEEELDKTESEDEEGTNNSSGPVSCVLPVSNNTENALATIPRDLVNTSTQHVFGSVQVSKSENVQFGNNVYFNGPVVIRQVVHPKEQDNLGYEHTKDNAPTNKPHQPNIEVKEENQINLLQLKLWLKLLFSLICVIVVVSVCAVLTITLTDTGHPNTTITDGDNSDSSTTECVTVVGYECLSRSLKFILISILLGFLTFTVLGSKALLTKETGGGNQKTLTTHKQIKVEAKEADKYNVEADPLLISPAHLRIVSRIDWLAQPVEKPLDKIKLPVPWVIIQHTATESCQMQSECVLSVRLIQMFHVESRGWSDIGYNFLVAGDGSAYFGRGWEYQGAHTLGYNKYSMGIAFIGTFNNEPPPKKQLDACKKLIQRGVELGKIAKDYKLFAHRQLLSTLSPGDKLFDILKEWPHFVKNFTDIEELLPNY